MMRDVTADQTTLMDQASKTIMYYYCDIESALDFKYGEGWSKDHADVVAQLVKACTNDYHSGCMLSALQDIREKLSSMADAINGIEFPSE